MKFEKGMTPWNKGQKTSRETVDKMLNTRLSKVLKKENWLFPRRFRGQTIFCNKVGYCIDLTL